MKFLKGSFKANKLVLKQRLPFYKVSIMNDWATHEKAVPVKIEFQKFCKFRLTFQSVRRIRFEVGLQTNHIINYT